METADECLIVMILEAYVCDVCKIKESDVRAYMDGHSDLYDDDGEYEDDLQSMLDDALPDDYDDLSERLKINLLMDTVCGLGFSTETNYDGDIFE